MFCVKMVCTSAPVLICTPKTIFNARKLTLSTVGSDEWLRHGVHLCERKQCSSAEICTSPDLLKKLYGR